MDQEGVPDGDQAGYEHKPLVNENPLSGIFFTGLDFVERYGWFLLIGVVIYFYVRAKFAPKLQNMQRKYNEERESKKFDASTAQRRMEAMEASRRKLQEQHDAEAGKYAEKMREKEEEKRKQRIEDWDGHQQGKGYRSKYKPKEEESSSQSKIPKPKSKPLRPADYNPLAGDGGSCSWRPAQRRGGGG